MAAILVLVTHLRRDFFVAFPSDPAPHTVLNSALFFITRLGPDAVMIFFVLSGYLVGGQAVMDARAGRFSLHRYMIARATRLYTVLIPALLLTATLDMLGGNWASSFHRSQTLLANLLFLQDIFGHVYGSNGPLWSLAFEWWFYVLFGLSVFVYGHRRIALRSFDVGLAGLLLLVLLVIFRSLIPLFLVWLGGVAIRTIRAPPARIRWPLVLLSVALLCILMLASTRDWFTLVSMRRCRLPIDYLVGAGAALLIWLLRNADPIRASWFAAGTTLASFSFTLYAIHQPLTALMVHLLVPHLLTHAGFAEWAALLIFAAGIVPCAFGWYWLFERNTPRIRRWLLAKLEPQGSMQTIGQAQSLRR